MISQENIFIDTGAWVALADRDDDCHRQAVSVYPSLLKSCRTLVTSNLVVAESYVLVLHALRHASCHELFGEDTCKSGDFEDLFE